MSLAEHFASAGLSQEALHFSDAALNRVIAESSNLDSDESAELLRQYAGVAERSEQVPSAFLALSLAMLMLCESNGFQSRTAESLTALVAQLCSEGSSDAIHKVGLLVVRGLREQHERYVA